MGFKNIPNDEEFINRFKGHQNNVILNKRGCWEWQGSTTSQGYGTLQHKKKRYGAHRVSYFLKNKKIDPTLVIDHICSNTICINPEHLQQVTMQENINLERKRRGQNFTKGDFNVTTLPLSLINGFCKHGHVISTINDLLVSKIRNTYRLSYQCKSCKHASIQKQNK